MANDEPITRGEFLAAMTEQEDRFDAALAGVQARLMKRLDEMAASLDEGYRDTQTEVLKAVYSMGERLQARGDAHEAIVTSLQQRQSSPEARLLEIEKRLNLPPAG